MSVSAALGRHTEAIASIQRSLELDPLSLIISATLARHGYHFARQYDKAVSQCRKTLDMDANFWVAHHFLGGILATVGRPAEAVAEFQTARALEANLEALAGLGYADGLCGNTREARQVVAELTELAKERYVSPILFALVHIGLGDNELAWLETAYEHRSQWLSEAGVDPWFDACGRIRASLTC